MSSEESGDDDSITVHPLPWCSGYVSKMFGKRKREVGKGRGREAGMGEGR